MSISTLMQQLPADELFPVFLDTAVKGVAILSLTALATLAMRRSSAAARHLVWFLGIVSLLILPILAAALPGWHILPHWTTNSPAAVQQSAATPVPPAIVPARPDAQLLPNDTPPQATIVAPTPAPFAPISPAISTPAAPLTWQSWLILIWLTGAALLLIHLAFGFLALCWLGRRSSRLADPSWPALLQELSRELGLRRPVMLLTHPARTMPMTWGVWKTRILLPEESAGWPAEQRCAVLLHELAHARRWDCLTQLITQLACAIYWFNPLIWLAWHRMQAERERACDDLVLSTGTKPSTYAQQLLHIASEMPALRFSAAAIAMARPSSLEARLRAILDVKRNRRMVTWGAVLLGAAVLLGVSVPLAMLRAGSPATQLTVHSEVRINELIYILRHSLMVSRIDQWASAIKELAEIGKPAVPALVRELDRADGFFEKSAIAFTLRAINDPRAVPSLVAALPRSAEQTGSWGLTAKNPELHGFMIKNATSASDEHFVFQGPLVELNHTLQRITGHREGDTYPKSNSPTDQEAAAKVRGELAESWRTWWAANHQTFATDAELATVENAPPAKQDAVEAAGLAKFGPLFPAGPDVHLGPVRDLVLPAETSVDVKAHLDFDTGRTFAQFEGGQRTSDRDYPRWLQQAGIDARVVGDSLVGADVHAWRVDNIMWEKLPEDLARLSTLEPDSRVMSSDFYPRRTQGEARLTPDALPVTLLFTTREGGRGILQVLGEDKQPRGLHIRYRMFQSPRLPIVQAANLSTQPVPTALSFGPERQVILYDPRSDKDAALSFDTGKTYVLPSGAYEAGYEKWLNASDAGVVIVLTDSSRTLLAAIRGTKISIQKVVPDAWDNLTPADVLDLNRRFPPSLDHHSALSIFPSLPQIAVFQTPNGVVGMVQILEANGISGKTSPMALIEGKYPRTLKLRYKTVQGASAASTQRAPASQPSTQAAKQPAASLQAVANGDFTTTASAADASENQSWINLQGQVIDDKTGQPVEDYTIQRGFVDPENETKVAWGGGTSSSRWAKGKFQKREGILKGEMGWFRILAKGYIPEPITPRPLIAPATEKNLVVRLKKGADLRGQVLDHTGKSVPSALVVLAAHQHLDLADGKPVEHYEGSRATADADGRFTLAGSGAPSDRVVVSTPSLNAWLAPVGEVGRELSIRLPQPATLTIRYDIEGADAEGVFRAALMTWDMPDWKNVLSSVQNLKCREAGEVVVANMTPGTYDIARIRHWSVGDTSRDYMCDRTTVTLKSGESATLDFVRKTGQRVTGRVIGLEGSEILGATILVRSPGATGNPLDKNEWKRTIFDAVTCQTDGLFQTSRLVPGRYTVVAEAYKPEPRSGIYNTGLRLPDLIAVADLVVPESGEASPITLELMPFSKATSQPATQPATASGLSLVPDPIASIRSILPEGLVIQKVVKDTYPYYLEEGKGLAVYVGLSPEQLALTPHKQEESLIVWIMPADYQGRDPDAQHSSQRQKPAARKAASTPQANIFVSRGDQDLARKVVEALLMGPPVPAPTTQTATKAVSPGSQPTATSFATPEELVAHVASAIESRDKDALCDAFGLDKAQDNSDALWVSSTLATLRLRDAMHSQFGDAQAEEALKGIEWLSAPDTKALRATRWAIEGKMARVRNERNSTDELRISGVIMWVKQVQEGWRMSVSVPASGETELRGNRIVRERVTLAEELTRRVVAGSYKTAEEVATAARNGAAQKRPL